MTNKYILDYWFKTWPIRIRKEALGTLIITPQLYEVSYKNQIMSLDVLPDVADNGNCILSTFGSNGQTMDRKQKSDTENIDSNQNLSLDSLLESLPLVYNPSTKQLQVVKLKSKLNDTVSSVVNSHLNRKYQMRQKILKTNKENSRFTEDEVCQLISSCTPDDTFTCISEISCDKYNFKNLSNSESFDSHNLKGSQYISSRRKDDTIFNENGSCPISNQKDCSSSSAISSPLKSDETSLVDSAITTKKRKGITELFTRNLFPWKSKRDGKICINHTEYEEDTGSCTTNSQDELSSSTWKLFTKSESSTSLDQKNFTQELPAGSVGLIMEERPGNLPAKTALEQQKHKLEYKSIITAAKKREIKEAKERKKAQALLLKQEKQLSDSVHVWNTVILPKWNTMRSHKRCQDLWWAGLPSCIRGKVWKLAIGNELAISPQLYTQLVRRSMEKLSSLNRSKSIDAGERESSTEPNDQESTLKLIQMDVSRTFPHLCIFQNGGPFHDPLHNILGAYVCYRPDIGYVQGMSFLAATLLLNMEESDAFIFFANLINRSPHLSFFSVDQRVMQAYYLTFEQILRENLPNLADHLEQLNVTPSMYFLDWVLTVFARSFPLDVAARMWDVYLRDGEEFLFRAAVGILKHFEKELLCEDCTALAAQFLTRLPEDLSVEALFRDVASIPVLLTSKKRIKELLEANLRKTPETRTPVHL